MDHLNGIPKKKKAKLALTANVNNKKIDYTLEFETEKIPERGSDAMFDAIFKAAKTCGGKLTDEDYVELEKQRNGFWGESSYKKKPDKGKKKNSDLKKSKNLEKLPDVLSQDQETLDLLAEVDALINSDAEESDDKSTTSSQILDTLPMPKRSKNKLATISVDSDSESDEDQGRNKSLGSLVFFQINLRGTRYPIRIYQKNKISEVRKMLGKKSGLAPECLTIFLGDDVQLENDQIVGETGIYDLCNLDAYYKDNTSLKAMYLNDSDAVIRFKLQTSDRRGRQTIFIYANKSAPMQNVRDDYSEQVGIDPTHVRLMFDGEMIDLNCIPEDCDLEGDECIDVIVK